MAASTPKAKAIKTPNPSSNSGMSLAKACTCLMGVVPIHDWFLDTMVMHRTGMA